MAAQIELAELKKAVEELGHKMDKQMVMVQGLIDLFTSIAPRPDMGQVKEPSQAYHMPADGTKLCSKDMFKDLAEFHEARTRPKEITGSLSNANAEINLKTKRVHPARSTMLCSYKASKGSTLNPQSNRRNPPRIFSCFSAPLSSIYEKLLEAGVLKPLLPTLQPRALPASHNPNAYCVFHQMPGHLTDACFRLRHAIQDLIDNGIIPLPLSSKVDTISNPSSQLKSDPLVGQISTTSTQNNPSSTILNPSRHIIPETQSKPVVSIPSKPEVGMLAKECRIEDGAETWKALVEDRTDQAKERTDSLRLFSSESSNFS